MKYARLAAISRRGLSLTLLAACWIVSVHSAVAQQPFDIPQMQSLLERIEQQDARLAELESELGRARRPIDAVNFRMLQQDKAESTGEGGEDDEKDSDEPSDEKSLEEFESRLKELEGGLGTLGDQVDSLGGENWVESGTPDSTIVLSGRLQIDGWGFGEADDALTDPAFEGEDPQNRLGFRRMRMGVAGDVWETMLYKIEVDFAGGNDVTFKDAYLGWRDVPLFQQVQIGNQKRPYGLDALNSSRYTVFLERSYAVDAFTDGSRRLGVMSYGTTDDLAYNWQYGFFNQQDLQDSGEYVGDHLQPELAGRFANTLWYDEVSGGRGYAHWAISGSLADPEQDSHFGNETRLHTRPEARSREAWIDTGEIENAETVRLLGLEGVVNVGPVQVVGEYLESRVDRSGGSPDLDFGGGYIYASYFLTGEHKPWDRETGVLDRVEPFENFWLVERCRGGVGRGWGAWQIAARYSYGDFSDADILGGVGESLTLGVNWHWNANAYMQFNYIDGRIDQRGGVAVAGPLAADYQIYGVRLLVDF